MKWFEEEMIKKDWFLYVFDSPFSLVFSQLILEIILNHWCRVEVACWGTYQLIDLGEVWASISSEALVNIHLSAA